MTDDVRILWKVIIALIRITLALLNDHAKRYNKDFEGFNKEDITILIEVIKKEL